MQRTAAKEMPNATPVQVIICRGKENVLSEKRISAYFGTTLVVGYSQVRQLSG